jgi:hypothetical protein
MIAYAPVGKIQFSFNHEQFKPTAGPSYAGHIVKGFTMCHLTVGDGHTFHATAWCSAEDNFNKELGRKLALEKVMRFAKLSREDRKEVWMSYFGRKNHASNGKWAANWSYNTWEAAI